MGWLSYGVSGDFGLKDVKEEIERNLEGRNMKTLYTSVKLGEAYSAIELTQNDGSTVVIATICLWKYNKKSGEFAIKVMDETVGPAYYNPTAKLLKMVTPTGNDYANDWRYKCWRNFKNVPKSILKDFEEKGFKI